MKGFTSAAVMNGGIARVRRKPDRARYDAEAVHAVLDAAPFCHVAKIGRAHV